MNIQSSNLLAGTSKIIKVVNGCIIATEGPNMISKMGLGGLSINYDSVMTTRQTLKSESRDTPIMYAFLGTNITFLTLVPKYGGTSPYTCSGSSNYLEYYYDDEPLVRRTLTDILVLSGDADHRIPQIYLYNPTAYTVTIDIMAANLDENEISTTLVPTFTELNGLSYNSVRSDQIFSVTNTGSTQFEIYDINGNIQMVIPYNKIDIITISEKLLTISTKSDDSVKLTFLSSFNAKQALSIMSWVMESTIDRYITSNYPGLDTTAPSITWKPYQTPQEMTYSLGVVNKTAIRTFFISGVTDYDDSGYVRDGIINAADVDLIIVNTTTGDQVTEITEDGNYSVTFVVTDLASNSVSSTKTIVVDALPPIIYYNTSAITYNIMDLTGDTSTPGTINYADIRTYYINYVADAVDIIIPNSSVDIVISSGATIFTSITGIGYYDISFSVSDYSSNITTGNTSLTVTESVAPVITYNNVFTGNTFYMSTGTTGLSWIDIRTYAVSGVSDNYDTSLTINDITLTGTTFPIVTTGTTTITFNVTDSSGNEASDDKILIT